MNSSIWENIPLNDLLRNFFARKPADVDGVLATSSLYYREYLLKKIFGRFDFANIPEFWDLDYFLDALFMDGYVIVTDTEAGIVPLKGGLTGINIFNHPTTAVIANPVLGNFERTIGVDCTIIQLQANYHGVFNLINRYATLLAMCDSSIAVNLINTKATFVFGAGSKAQAQTFKQLYDKISCGEPAVFTKESLVEENLFIIPAKNNFIADDVQILKRKIINEFLTEIGINNSNLDKRERVTDDEINANNVEVMANIQHWIDNITRGINETNQMFDLGIRFIIRKFGGNINESAKLS